MINWRAMIEAAQTQGTYLIDSKPIPRIAHGDTQPCSDCAVEHGQLHVPGCCVERCPGCAAQAISCLCNRGYN